MIILNRNGTANLTSVRISRVINFKNSERKNAGNTSCNLFEKQITLHLCPFHDSKRFYDAQKQLLK